MGEAAPTEQKDRYCLNCKQMVRPKEDSAQATAEGCAGCLTVLGLVWTVVALLALVGVHVPDAGWATSILHIANGWPAVLIGVVLFGMAAGWGRNLRKSPVGKPTCPICKSDRLAAGPPIGPSAGDGRDRLSRRCFP